MVEKRKRKSFGTGYYIAPRYGKRSGTIKNNGLRVTLTAQSPSGSLVVEIERGFPRGLPVRSVWRENDVFSKIVERRGFTVTGTGKHAHIGALSLAEHLALLASNERDPRQRESLKKDMADVLKNGGMYYADDTSFLERLEPDVSAEFMKFARLPSVEQTLKSSFADGRDKTVPGEEYSRKERFNETDIVRALVYGEFSEANRMLDSVGSAAERDAILSKAAVVALLEMDGRKNSMLVFLMISSDSAMREAIELAKYTLDTGNLDAKTAVAVRAVYDAWIQAAAAKAALIKETEKEESEMAY